MMFESTQARLLIALSIPVVILSQRVQFSMVTLITQLLLYLALAYNADCLVSGQCKAWAWLVILFPLVNTLGYLFFVDKLKLNSPVQLPIPRTFERIPPPSPFAQPPIAPPPQPMLKSSEEMTYGPGPQ